MKTITKQFARLFLLAVCFGITTASMKGQVTVTAQGQIGAGEGIDKLTDGNLTTKWLDNTNPSSSWVKFAYVGAEKWNQYAITSGNDEPSRDPKNWTISGSNDGTSWTVLDTRSDITWSARSTTQTYQFTNSTYYLYYKWDITAFNGASMTQVTEFAFSYFSTDDEIVPTVPANLSVGAITKNSVALSWTHSVNVMGVTTYDVYKNGSLAGSTTSSNFTATGLAASTLYSFYVIAKDGFGSAAATDAVTATTAAAPSIPTYRYLKLTVNAHNNENYGPNFTELEWMDGTTSYPTTKMDFSPTNGTATVSASLATDAGNLWKAFDGGYDEGWSYSPVADGAFTAFPYSITLDLGDGNGILPTTLNLGMASWGGRGIQTYSLDGSNDDLNWTNLKSVTSTPTSTGLNTITIDAPVPTALSAVKGEVLARIYNSNGKIAVDLTALKAASTVSVIDTKGSVIKTIENAGAQLLTINVANKGVYLVRVQNGAKVSTAKVVL